MTTDRQVGVPSERGPAAPPGILVGEALSFPERLLVAPRPGVVHRRRVRIGRHLEPGVVLVDLRSDRSTIRIGSPVRGTFVTWVVDEGERVDQGRVLARIRPDA